MLLLQLGSMLFLSGGDNIMMTTIMFVRYGDMDQLKNVVRRLHDVEIKVLGDVVLNHRCAQFQNQNGVWNIFGGRLNWDDSAVVCDDPHFQV